MRRPLRILLTLSAILAAQCGTAATVSLASPFGDHMVLQRDQAVPVWGWAEPGTIVTVNFANQAVSATADDAGAWKLQLAPLAVSAQPRDFVVSSTHPGSNIENQKFTDVLVGDVWLCGGQSNMERQLGLRGGQKPLVGWEAEVASADRPLLRQLYVTQTRAPAPQATVEAAWSVCTPETAIDFTAVGYYFGRDLQEHLNIPIGLIHASWGGTPAESWTSREGLAGFPAFAGTLDMLAAAGDDPAALAARYRADLDQWYVDHDPGTSAAGSGWSAPSLDTTDWLEMNLPTMWENAGHEGFDGVGWFRRRFDLPAGWAGRDLVLKLGAIDDIDTTWLNGRLLGSTAGYITPRVYRVSADSLQAGGNVIAVRILDTGGGGGIWLDNLPLEIAPADAPAEALSLRGPWSYQLVASFATTPPPPSDPNSNAQAPTVLYNGMIAPVIPYALRGFTFYQGEANAGRSAQYRRLLPALIDDWRQRWGDPELPFLFVQIAPFNDQPPEIREAQLQAWQATPNTAMVVTIDAGDAEDIHPALKEPVGERLALAARALSYGEDIVYSGPVFRRAEFGPGQVVLHFDHVGDGLVAPGGQLHGFTIAGSDGVYHEATARIVGGTVVVSSADVTNPAAVRYGWANVASGNLFNTAGLPASPFRTDAP